MEMILAGHEGRFEFTESARAVNRDQKGAKWSKFSRPGSKFSNTRTPSAGTKLKTNLGSGGDASVGCQRVKLG